MKPFARAVALVLLAATPVHADGDMEPYKMLRSLQLVQDRLARGDHAALPMQQKLLELTDKRFRAASKEEFSDPRNMSALLVYAMSGGNPATVEIVLSRTAPEEKQSAIGRGALAYMRGNVSTAAEILASVDPMEQAADVGAFVALVKGSVIASAQPDEALKLMDQARLLAPGTLVEEAALRRSLPLVLTLEMPQRFLVLAEQYTRRFLRSPYASEFADAFVEGLVTFHGQLREAQIEQVVSLMSVAQQEAIYLRLARRSTIKGHVARSTFASEKAAAMSQGGEAGDPRAALYKAISSITSENIEEVLEQLEGVDPAQLSPRDRSLLSAARSIAADVIAPPLPAVESADPVPAEAPAPAANPPQPAATAPAVAMGGAVARDPDAPSELASSVRAKLDAVDRLLRRDLQR